MSFSSGHNTSDSTEDASERQPSARQQEIKQSDLLLLRRRLDEECLHRSRNGGSESAQSEISAEELKTRILHLSDSLIAYENADSPLQRELQFRALLSALALLRYSKAHTLSVEFWDALHGNINSRFREVVFQSNISGQINQDGIRKAACSYLIRLALEYAKPIRRAEPRVVSILFPVFKLFFAGLSIAGGQWSPQSLCESLNTISRLWQAPQTRYQALLGLQELTRITTTIHFKARAARQTSNNDELEASKDLARRVLLELFNKLKEDSKLGSISPPSVMQTYWENCLAAFNRPPPGLDRYFQLYGLLDCVAQLGRIMLPDDFSSGLRSMMTGLILKSDVAQFRWKAIEVLMASKETRDSQYGSLLNEARQVSAGQGSQICQEIDVVRECLEEEEFGRRGSNDSELFKGRRLSGAASGSVSPPLPGSTSLVTASRLGSLSTSTESSKSIRAGSNSKWNESPAVEHQREGFPQTSQIPLSRKYSVAGLSNDCSSAYFFNEKFVCVHSFATADDLRTALVFEKKYDSKTKLREVALSRRFVVTRTNESLTIFNYGLGSKHTDALASLGNTKWDPSGLALHESEDHLLILAGERRRNSDGKIEGRIKIYKRQIDDVKGRIQEVGPCRIISQDCPKTIAFGTNGKTFACVTGVRNSVLIWTTDDESSPNPKPFEILNKYTAETEAEGITSVALLKSSTEKDYVLCTTSPSSERWRNKGEWSFIAPVGSPSMPISSNVTHCFEQLKHRLALVAGAVPIQANLAAVLERTGKIMLLPLAPHDRGGLCSKQENPLELEASLCSQANPSSSCIRFDPTGTRLLAIDMKGKVIMTKFKQTAPQKARHDSRVSFNAPQLGGFDCGVVFSDASDV